MNSISEESMEPGTKIESLIQAARDKALGEQRRREQDLDARRIAAMTKIGEAALRYHVSDSVLEKRVTDASTVRISQTEAYAILSAQGDFTSQLMWWDIRAGERSQTLWKGYVLFKRVFFKRLAVGFHVLEVTARSMVAEGGGYVAECCCDNGNVLSVGFSKAGANDAALASLKTFDQALSNESTEGIRLAFMDVLNDPGSFVSGGLTPEVE